MKAIIIEKFDLMTQFEEDHLKIILDCSNVEHKEVGYHENYKKRN